VTTDANRLLKPEKWIRGTKSSPQMQSMSLQKSNTDPSSTNPSAEDLPLLGEESSEDPKPDSEFTLGKLSYRSELPGAEELWWEDNTSSLPDIAFIRWQKSSESFLPRESEFTLENIRSMPMWNRYRGKLIRWIVSTCIPSTSSLHKLTGSTSPFSNWADLFSTKLTLVRSVCRKKVETWRRARWPWFRDGGPRRPTRQSGRKSCKSLMSKLSAERNAKSGIWETILM